MNITVNFEPGDEVYYFDSGDMKIHKSKIIRVEISKLPSETDIKYVVNEIYSDQYGQNAKKDKFFTSEKLFTRIEDLYDRISGDETPQFFKVKDIEIDSNFDIDKEVYVIKNKGGDVPIKKKNICAIDITVLPSHTITKYRVCGIAGDVSEDEIFKTFDDALDYLKRNIVDDTQD
jgi:hypothetical protein